ncbi:hypothetical protein C8Q77DRAFT_1135097 [Trametes polyzona]|nr:hypothetical protein C8Q77DRAFT_1135097 [Trametes polyzona]
MMSTPAEETVVPFSFFVELVHGIASIKPRRATERQPRFIRYVDQPAYKTFQRWIGALRERYAPLPAGMTATIFRFLFPEEDVRRKYGMQETRLAQCLTKILGVSSVPHGRGKRLLNWKNEDALGCLGEEVETIMAESSTKHASGMSIARVDSLLAGLASTCAFSADSTRKSFSGFRRTREAILTELYNSLTPSECAVLTQIILKDLRPLLYPIPRSASHYTSALLEYKSNAVTMLTKEAAMHAWDPSGRMSLIFRMRANLEEAALAFESFANGEGLPQPTVGVPIQIPKCVKGQGPAHSLKALKRADKVWVETKYDGERAQIHVWFDDDGVPHIRIFSKSGRDSTLDRAGVHTVIYNALRIPRPDAVHGEEDTNISRPPSFSRNIIVEAEMVAYSDVLGRIDEFWRIRSLIATTAIGVRHKSLPPGPSTTQQEAMETQCSLISNASDGGTRHLALVFFDVLLVDDLSLLSFPYGERRSILEGIITPKPGYAMLAERTLIDLASEDPQDALRRAFARVVADHQEGVVVKADGATYAERRWPWVKLKQDYIPGHGDSVDLVLLGASWEKERARELRVPPTAYTTFYFGALSNADELKEHPTRRPHFEVICTSSYGLDRAHLEELNFIIKSTDPVLYRHQASAGLSYTFRLCPSLSPPAVLLRKPLLAEVFGAGFTKSPGNLFYELRFPRIAKIFRPSDRPWIDGTTLDELQSIARAAVGRDRSGKAEDDWARTMFRPDEPPSPGARCPVKRKRTEDIWVERLKAVDEKVGARSPAKRARIEGDWGVHAGWRPAWSASALGDNVENEATSSGRQATATGDSIKQRTGMVRLTSVTNMALPASPISPAVSQASGLSQDGNKGLCLPERTYRLATPPSSPPAVDEDEKGEMSPTCTPERTKSNAPLHPSTPETLDVAAPRSIGQSRLNTPTVRSRSPPRHDAPVDLGPEPPEDYPVFVTITQFLEDAAVWLSQPTGAPRPSWRMPSNTVIPRGSAYSTLNALLVACGWLGTTSCSWVARGVVFVDEAEEKGERLAQTVKDLAMHRASVMLRNQADRGVVAQPKSIYVMSMRLLARDAFAETASAAEWEKRAICVFG